jgi:hypothetical protein
MDPVGIRVYLGSRQATKEEKYTRNKSNNVTYLQGLELLVTSALWGIMWSMGLRSCLKQSGDWISAHLPVSFAKPLGILSQYAHNAEQQASSVAICGQTVDTICPRGL